MQIVQAFRWIAYRPKAWVCAEGCTSSYRLAFTKPTVCAPRVWCGVAALRTVDADGARRLDCSIDRDSERGTLTRKPSQQVSFCFARTCASFATNAQRKHVAVCVLAGAQLPGGCAPWQAGHRGQTAGGPAAAERGRAAGRQQRRGSRQACVACCQRGQPTSSRGESRHAACAVLSRSLQFINSCDCASRCVLAHWASCTRLGATDQPWN
jgi:hypothetical protein